MDRFTFQRTATVLGIMLFLFVFYVSAYALFGTSPSWTVTSTQSQTLTTTSTSATSTKGSLLIKQPTKKSATSTTSTEIKIIKPKPIQIPLAPKGRMQDALVSGQYIVVLKKTTSTDPLPDVIKKYGISPIFQYKKALYGFAAKLDVKKMDLLKKDPRIEYIAQDRIVSILATTQTKKKSIAKKSAAKKSSSQKTPPLTAQPLQSSVTSTPSTATTTSTTSTLPTVIAIPPPPDPKKIQIIPTGYSRIFAHSATIKGTGVGVAVLDTGIDLAHPDLKPHITANATCIRAAKNGNDDNGHGTHVAGIIGALDNSFGVIGVAPQANLIAIKVLDAQGGGTWSSVLCGIEWIENNALKYAVKTALMGFGGSGTSDSACGRTNNDPLHRALCQSAQSGITYIAAAGNEGADISMSVPAAYIDTVITVSAVIDTDGGINGKGVPTTVGEDDTFASLSNSGLSVTIGAPGVNILSTGKNGTYYSASGTSMAAAYVAGTAALYAQTHPATRWTDVRTALQLAGEHQNAGHSDSSGNHPEVVLQVVVF
ncbi:S8 family serine peptidase [Candidatus Uhrbacteria bacterium]|nr:S8 family serine peptidase [Candidatus Uhrbacteria bacterium]